MGRYLCLLGVPFLILWGHPALADKDKSDRHDRVATAAPPQADLAPQDLFVFGDFDRRVAGKTAVKGVEVYEIDCDQGAGDCIDNLGNVWGFGAPLDRHFILICESGRDAAAMGCVHAVEITVYTEQPYRDVFAEIERAGCETNEVVFDERAFERRGHRDGVLGTIEGGENQYVNVTFTLGRIRPQRPHTLVVRSPDGSPVEGCTQGMNSITGIAIVGTPKAPSPWRRR